MSCGFHACHSMTGWVMCRRSEPVLWSVRWWLARARSGRRNGEEPITGLGSGWHHPARSKPSAVVPTLRTLSIPIVVHRRTRGDYAVWQRSWNREGTRGISMMMRSSTPYRGGNPCNSPPSWMKACRLANNGERDVNCLLPNAAKRNQLRDSRFRIPESSPSEIWNYGSLNVESRIPQMRMRRREFTEEDSNAVERNP